MEERVTESGTKTATLLLAVYVIEFFVLAISPYDRPTWWAENIPIVIIVSILVLLWLRGIRFSPLAYLLMSVLPFLHTIGGHYTFEKVPFSLVTELLGAERNHFDRIAHFSVGFYAYAIAEGIDARRLITNSFLLMSYAVFAIAAVAMSYELIEWWYAALSDPAAGAAFLGSQGDPWDAQKDMLADTLGAIAAVLLYCQRRRVVG